MLTLTQSTTASAPSPSNLGRLIYRYLKTMEINHPGIFLQLADKEAAESPIEAGRLFKGLEIRHADETNNNLGAIEAEINSKIGEKTNDNHFNSLKKAIKKMKLSLSLKNIERLFNSRDDFIRNLMGTKYNARLDRFLRRQFKDAAIRENIQNFIFNAILFRCYSHIISSAKSKPKQYVDLTQKQKFLVDIYKSGLKDPSDILTAIEISIRKKISADLESAAISTVIETGQYRELDAHIDRLPAYFNEVKTDYRYTLNPAVITSSILTHLSMITFKLREKQIESTLRPLLAKKQTRLIIDFLENHMKYINECFESQIKANALIEILKLDAITSEFTALNDLQKCIQEHAPKSSTLAQKRTSTKITSTRKTSQERPPLPTSARVSDLSVFAQQLRDASPSPEPSEYKLKN